MKNNTLAIALGALLLGGVATAGFLNNRDKANDIQVRIARLEQQVQYSARNGRYNNGYGYNGYNNGYYDRDRDDRDDRYEDDHGYRHDR